MSQTSDLASLLVQLVKQQKVITKPIVTILRYFVYSRKQDLKKAFTEGGVFVEAVKTIFEGLTNDEQTVRKEAGRAIKFMLEVDCL